MRKGSLFVTVLFNHEDCVTSHESLSVGTIRQVMSDLYILSWFIQPMHDNRDYYASLMQLKDKPNYNADKFLFLFE